MKRVRCHTLTDKSKASALRLWNESYPQQLIFGKVQALDTYIATLAEVEHLLCYDGELLIGWAFKFLREESKWFALLVHTEYQLKGIGTLLLKELKKEEMSLRGWVVDHDLYKTYNGETYRSPLLFYIKNDFSPQNTVRLETPLLSAVQILWIHK